MGTAMVHHDPHDPPEYVKRFFRRWAISVGYVIAAVTLILGIQLYYLLK